MIFSIARLRPVATIITIVGFIASPVLARPAIKSAPTDAIDRAAKGLIAQIEDDIAKKGDWMFQSVRTIACTSILSAKPVSLGGNAALGSWTIDWTAAESAQMHYNFVHIKAPGIQFNIVGDGKTKANRKLGILAAAMQAKMGACQRQV